MWQQKDKHLEKTYEFNDFNDAWRFINQIAEKAEALNHHPSIQWNYNKVTIQCSTFDQNNTITPLDFQLAQAIDSIPLQS